MGNIVSNRDILTESELSPIVVFAFNRPISLSNLLSDMKDQSYFLERDIYIYIDGPRNDAEAVLVEETRSVAQSLKHPKKEIILRDENIGLKSSLISGVTEVLSRYDSAIVLEDDLRLGCAAFEYFQNGIDKYRHDEIVVSICGYAIGTNFSSTDNGASFLPMTHPWGWATWRNRWAEYLNELPREKSISSKSFKNTMDVSGLRNYYAMLRLADMRLISSWWIYWQRHLVIRNGVSLFPHESHVCNSGMSGVGGTHSSKKNFLTGLVPKKKLSDTLPKLPEKVRVDFEKLDEIISSREAKIFRLIGTAGYVRRIWGNFFRFLWK